MVIESFIINSHALTTFRYAIAIIAFIWVLYTLFVTGLSTARAKGNKLSRFYTLIAAYTAILWIAYPIVWAVAASTRRLSVDGEIIAYAILDVLAKGVFGAWLLFTHRYLAESHISVGGFWTHGLNTEGSIRVGEDDEGA
jgi:bacteriorhodopsin